VWLLTASDARDDRPWFVRWLLPRLPALPSPDGLARELGRLLGPAYTCEVVSDAAAAARRVGRQERVILHGAHDQIGSAIAALGPLRVEMVTAPEPLAEPAMIEAYAETIREGVMALRSEYSVLFCAAPGHGADAAVRDLVSATRLARQWVLASVAPPFARLRLRLAAWRLSGAILAVPLLLDVDTSALGMRVTKAPDLGTRPTYVRALLALVRRAEAEAGWLSS
jgi:hypothetical protein